MAGKRALRRLPAGGPSRRRRRGGFRIVRTRYGAGPESVRYGLWRADFTRAVWRLIAIERSREAAEAAAADGRADPPWAAEIAFETWGRP
jgi:hypothetical protein